METYRFAEAPETLVQTLRVILEGKAILFVEHDEYGGWHFFDDRPIVALWEMTSFPLGDLVGKDSSLNALADLPRAWQAFRDTKDQLWERESVKTKDKSRARIGEALKWMRETSTPLPPGAPTTLEIIREARGE